MTGTADLPRRMTVEAALRPLRIAVVCSRFPLPMTRADQMTVAHFLAFLAARGHQVDLFSLVDSTPTKPAHEWLATRCRRMQLFKQPWWRRCLGVALGLLRRQPLQVGLFANGGQCRALRAATRAGDYDVVYAYTLRSAEAARGLRGAAATFLAMQVSQALNTSRIARQAPSAGERLLYRLEHWLTARYEAAVWQDFTHTTLVGEADAAAIRTAGEALALPPIDNYLLAPHGVDAERFQPRGTENPLHIVFCGVMATNTNVGAVLWFVREVWPRLRAEHPGASFAIVGRMPRAEIRALHGRNGIVVTGEVADPADAIGEAAVCIDPMQAGAGMQNKLLEYFAAGKAVVATTVANEGIRATPGEHLLVADDGAAFAAAVGRLLADAALRHKLGAAARDYVLREWTWERHFLRLEEHFYATSETASG